MPLKRQSISHQSAARALMLPYRMAAGPRWFTPYNKNMLIMAKKD
jgi:hypothetical protein